MPNLRIAAFFVCLPLLAVAPAHSDEPLCGEPPSLSSVAESAESVKGELKGQADLLTRFVGKAELAGQAEAARHRIYQTSDSFIAAQKDAYLSYMFCVVVMQDKTLSTSDKLRAIREFKSGSAVGVNKERANAPAQREIKGFSNTQLREAAINFAASMRTFSANTKQQTEDIMFSMRGGQNADMEKKWEDDNKALSLLLNNFSLSFANTYLGTYIEMKNEIETRLKSVGLFPPYGEGRRTEMMVELLNSGSQNYNVMSVEAGADYLEFLARKLPND